MTDVTYSVSHVARTIDRSPQTVRGWTGRYRKYLSESAQVDAGQERRYTDDDVALLQSVDHLSKQGQKHANIMPMLAGGFKIDPETIETPPDETTTNLAKQNEVARFTRLMDTIEVEVKARVDAEKRAAAAEARLAMIWRRHWWQLWRPERPQDGD
jgi:DNA-binding transcriptional MerR regulator